MTHSFDLIYQRAERVFENWESWFDENAPEDVYPGDLIQPMDAVAGMLERGETLWHHAGWLKTLGQVIHDWSLGDRTLIRLRLTCQWLISTLPDSPLDSDLARRIHLIAKGDWCDAFPGLQCPLHRDPDASTRDLHWAAASRAIAWRSSISFTPEQIRRIREGRSRSVSKGESP